MRNPPEAELRPPKRQKVEEVAKINAADLAKKAEAETMAAADLAEDEEAKQLFIYATFYYKMAVAALSPTEGGPANLAVAAAATKLAMEAIEQAIAIMNKQEHAQDEDASTYANTL